MAEMIKLTIDPKFAKELQELAAYLKRWQSDVLPRLETAGRVIANRWQAEATKRVPVDNSTLKQRILTSVDRTRTGVEVRCGTNLDYGKWLEFGTRFIAGGRVMRVGNSPDVTDAQAITDWPAKSRDGTTGPEQMPWLRPAMNAIKDWAVQMIIDAARAPGT